MHTILGAGGSIGTELALALPGFTNKIRQVGRNPKKVNAFDEVFRADLLNPQQLDLAVKGSQVAYLTVGLPYNTKVWESNWPKLMGNVIDACQRHGTRLVFFDNMYMYAPDAVPMMTETSPDKPCSRKGVVRKKIADMVMEADAAGKISALIARGADFYGPGIRNSLLGISVVDRLIKGKKANWFCDTRFKHSFTYTPDAGKAVAILGNDPKAFGQIWHMPTAPDPLSGKAWVEAFAEEIGAKPGVQVAGKTLMSLMGLFVPIMKEFRELAYQWDRDYVFNSSKFEKQYGFKPTPYEKGIQAVAAAAQKKG